MRHLPLAFVLFAAPALAQSPGLRGIFLPQVSQEATAAGVPPEIADAVAMVETGYRPEAVGTSGEIGIMQILPSTAAQLGFHGTLDELRAPAVNIHLAVEYLARAWAQSDGDICKALTKYRAGLGEDVTSPLSALYCSRALSWLRGGQATAPAFTQTAAADPYVVKMPAAPAPQIQVLGPPQQASELYYKPLVAQQMPAPQPTQARIMPVVAMAPLPIRPAGHHGRKLRQPTQMSVAALQADLDSHLRVIGNQATTSFDSGN